MKNAIAIGLVLAAGLTLAACSDIFKITQTVTVTLRPTNLPGPNGEKPECAGLVVGATGVAGGIELSLPENGPSEVAAFVDGVFRGTFANGAVIADKPGAHTVSFSTLDGACESDAGSVEVPA